MLASIPIRTVLFLFGLQRLQVREIYIYYNNLIIYIYIYIVIPTHFAADCEKMFVTYFPKKKLQAGYKGYKNMLFSQHTIFKTGYKGYKIYKILTSCFQNRLQRLQTIKMVFVPRPHRLPVRIDKYYQDLIFLIHPKTLCNTFSPYHLPLQALLCHPINIYCL